MEFTDVVMRRRMFRRFADEPVAPEVIERIARLAQRTPSAGFSQGQRIVVVTDPALRRRIGLVCGEAPDIAADGWGPWVSTCAAQFIPCVSEATYHRRYREPDKLLPDGQEVVWPVPYWWMDIGCTVMAILLAAVNEGLGAGFAGTDDLAALRSELGMPDEFTPVGVIPVGRPLPDRRSPSLRRGWVPFDDFARRERW